MRGDQGGENIEVSVWMIKHRGTKRASFMWGSSTRNTHIERLWVEVGTQFARRWISVSSYGVEEDIDKEWEDVDDMIAADQRPDVRHDPVGVPSHGSPFNSELEEIFFAGLEAVKSENIIPYGFDLDLDTYPARESIHLGRGGKRISVVLPSDVWWPRALLWAHGLDLMTRIIVEAEL
ncbi:hypothetical protein C8R45DRAFT_937408 [Mycena sanguinolenta]|nr:hypothetical protein C8R45DRAFT_937408 [Mycena sanguinolenta]